MSRTLKLTSSIVSTVLVAWLLHAADPGQNHAVNLPTSKQLIVPVPGSPQRMNSFPAAMAVSPAHRYVAIMNDGFGTADSYYKQSIAIVDLSNGATTDFPDSRLAQHASQSFFMGLAFNSSGNRLFASIGSLTDPEGKHGGTGNGIAVYNFNNGKLEPASFYPIAVPELGRGKTSVAEEERSRTADKQSVAYPAGIAAVSSRGRELLLIAGDLSDDAVLMDSGTGQEVHRFDLSRHKVVPAEYPYAAAATRDGRTGFVSLWNDSAVAQLDLETGRVARFIDIEKPHQRTSPGSHPSALLLSPDEKWLYVTLANRDEVAVIETRSGKVRQLLSTKLPGQEYGGAYPNALAQNQDGTRLFVGNAGADAVAVFDTSHVATGIPSALGF